MDSIDLQRVVFNWIIVWILKREDTRHFIASAKNIKQKLIIGGIVFLSIYKSIIYNIRIILFLLNVIFKYKGFFVCFLKNLLYF